MADDKPQQEPKQTQQTQPKGIDPKTGEPYKSVEIPVPRQSLWDRLLHRAENTSSRGGDSGPYAGADAVLDQKARELNEAFREGPPTDY
jgi:hypothetical protein